MIIFYELWFLNNFLRKMYLIFDPKGTSLSKTSKNFFHFFAIQTHKQ